MRDARSSQLTRRKRRFLIKRIFIQRHPPLLSRYWFGPRTSRRACAWPPCQRPVSTGCGSHNGGTPVIVAMPIFNSNTFHQLRAAGGCASSTAMNDRELFPVCKPQKNSGTNSQSEQRRGWPRSKGTSLSRSIASAGPESMIMRQNQPATTSSTG